MNRLNHQASRMHISEGKDACKAPARSCPLKGTFEVSQERLETISRSDKPSMNSQADCSQIRNCRSLVHRLSEWQVIIKTSTPHHINTDTYLQPASAGHSLKLAE